MFVWCVLLCPKKNAGSDDLERFKLLLNNPNGEEGDSDEIIRTKALEKGVLAIPGTVFWPHGRKSAYVRVPFSLASDEDIDEGIRRLREVIIAARSSDF